MKSTAILFKSELFIRGVIAAVFVLPLIVFDWALYPYHFVKWMAVLFIIFLTAWMCVLKRIPKNFFWHPLLIALAVLVSVRSAWGFFGLNAYRSFFGDMLRLNGTWVFAVFLLGAWMITLWACDESRRRWIFFCASLSTIIFAAFGWLVAYAPSFFNVDIGTRGLEGRFIGLAGNSAYFAAYLLTGVFFVLAAFFSSQKKWQKVFFLACVVGVVATLIFSQTRAGIVGLSTGLGSMALVYAWSSRKKIVRVSASIAILFFVIIMLFVALNPFVGSAHTPFSRISLENLSKLTTLGSTGTRLYLWKSAWDGFIAQPIFGWGPEMYTHAFDQHFPLELLKFSFYETWADRPHNIVLEYLVSMGIVGVLVWLGLLVSVFLTALRIFRVIPAKAGIHLNEESKKYWIPAFAGMTQPKGIVVSLVGVWGAYAGFALFTFETPSLVLHLFLSAGLLASYNLQTHILTSFPRPACRSLGVGGRRESSIFLIGVGLFIFWYLFFIPVYSAYHARIAEKLFIQKNKTNEVHSALQNAFHYNNFATADIFKTLTDDLYNNEGREIFSSEMYKISVPILLDAAQKLVKEELYNYRIVLRQAQLFYLAAKYIDRSVYEPAAIDAFSHARLLSPNRQVTYFNEVGMYLQFGEFDRAEKLVSSIGEEQNSLALIEWLRALVVYGKGDKKSAGEHLATALALGYGVASDQEILEYVLEVLEANNDYPRIIKVLKNLLMDNDPRADVPHLGINYLRLGYALANIGKFDEAHAQALLAVERDPSLKDEVEKFVNEMKTMERGTRND